VCLLRALGSVRIFNSLILALRWQEYVDRRWHTQFHLSRRGRGNNFFSPNKNDVRPAKQLLRGTASGESESVGSHNSIAANDYRGQGRWGTPTRGQCGQRAMNPYLKTQSNWGTYMVSHTKTWFATSCNVHMQQKLKNKLFFVRSLIYLPKLS